MVLWIADAHTRYQSGLNVPQLAADGFAGLIVKASESAPGWPSSWTASGLADTWVDQARAAGMVVGAYHWLTSAPAEAQVDHYLGRIAEMGGPDGMLCAVDVEDRIRPPEWNTLHDFLSIFYARTQHSLIIYSGNWWWQSRGWNFSSMSPYLWDSRYVTGVRSAPELYDEVPESWWTPRYGGWSQATMLQFTSTGVAGGIHGDIDISAFRGSIEDLRSIAGIQPAEPAKEPEVFFYKINGTDDVYISNGIQRRHVSNIEYAEMLNILPALGLFNNGEMLTLAHHIGVEVRSSVVLYRVPDAPTPELADEIWATNGVSRWHVPDAAELQAIRDMADDDLIDLADDGAVQTAVAHVGQPVGLPITATGEEIAEPLAAAVTSWLTGPVTQLAATVSEAVTALTDRQTRVAAALAAAGEDLAAADDAQPE